MHPKLLESTIAQCRAYMEAGDCHGEAPPTERLIAAVEQLADRVALEPQDAKFLAARLRRLFAHFKVAVPDGGDDARLIGNAAAGIGLLLTAHGDGVEGGGNA